MLDRLRHLVLLGNHEHKISTHAPFKVDVLNVLGVTRRVQLCMLEVVEGGLCLLDVLDVMRCMLLCMLQAVEGGSVCGRCWRYWRCRG